MALSLAYSYCTEADVQAILSVDGELARADDDGDGTLSPAEKGYVADAIYRATAEVNRWCLARYADADLAQSPIVNVYCSCLAVRWLCRRRGNPCPGAVEATCEDAVEFFRGVQSGAEQIADVGQREGCTPVWSNVRVNWSKLLRKVEVERPISERTPTTYPQDRDLAAEYIVRPL